MSTGPRKTYLETIGLSLDPFATPVAEQELAQTAYSLAQHKGALSLGSDADRPPFFAYYSPPANPLIEGDTLLEVLRQPRAAFVYGQHGAGKTTLRLRLEAECRRVPSRKLVVSYVLTQDVTRSLAGKQHGRALAEALAIDLFVQIVEQFSPLDPPPTPDQISALRSQLLMGGRTLKRLVERILDSSEPETLLGLGALWPTVRRPAVRYVARSQPLLDLIAQSLPTEWRTSTGLTGEAALRSGFEAAKAWGFGTVFVLIDGVDSRRRRVSDMMALIRPLLDKMALWQQDSVFPKFFLPVEMQSAVSAYLEASRRDLHSRPFQTIIIWDEVSLRALLVERFRASHSRRLGFDDLAGTGLKGKLDALILRAAHGSPRRLLLTISSLINVHAARNAHDPLISLDDWENMRATWGSQPPPPPAATDA